MSKLETPITLWFWHQVGGLLIEEFVAVRRTASQGQRLIDAVIVLGEKKRRLKRGAEFDLAGRDVIAVQSKHRRLGMTVAGQTLFSKELLKRSQHRIIRRANRHRPDAARLNRFSNSFENNVCPATVIPSRRCFDCTAIKVSILLELQSGCEVRVYPVRHAVS